MQNKQKYFIVSLNPFPRQWVMHTLDDISRQKRCIWTIINIDECGDVIKVKPYQVLGFPEYDIGKKEISTQKHFI